MVASRCPGPCGGLATAPLPGIRIQIWAHTTEGYETDAQSHGATLTDANGVFRLEMPQPLLAVGYLPGLQVPRGRRVHRWVGTALVAAIIIHVGGLWLTSPRDVVDALLFDSPTPFSAGVVAMWAAFAAALRRPLRIRPRLWRLDHIVLVVLASRSPGQRGACQAQRRRWKEACNDAVLGVRAGQ